MSMITASQGRSEGTSTCRTKTGEAVAHAEVMKLDLSLLRHPKPTANSGLG